jgi:hypothetical protein
MGTMKDVKKNKGKANKYRLTDGQRDYYKILQRVGSMDVQEKQQR